MIQTFCNLTNYSLTKHWSQNTFTMAESQQTSIKCKEENSYSQKKTVDPTLKFKIDEKKLLPGAFKLLLKIRP